jgi:hypothetical protein
VERKNRLIFVALSDMVDNARGTAAMQLLCLFPSSSDGNRKPPGVTDRHKAEPKAEKRANRHSGRGGNFKHLSNHHNSSSSQRSNGVKVRP